MSKYESRKLEIEATKILRKAGATYGGRDRGEVDPAQAAFERRHLNTPTGSGKRR